MYKGIPYANKIIKRRQEQRLQVIHKQNLRNIRPLTTNIDIPFQAVAHSFANNKKKDMLQQDRFTEIERQNRMLLEKIHTIMNKKPTFKQEKLKRNNSINNDRERMNKSLNQVYRKRQLGDIQIQNAKLLKRIMDKKSDYDSKKLKQEWKKQKQVIKNIANYPFIIRDRIYKGRKKSMTSHSFNQPGFTANIQQEETSFSSPIQLVRIRNLSGHNFLITVKYDGTCLQILGDNKSTKEIKIIEIPKQEGLEFIQYECDGKIQLIFDCLRYDSNQKILYLVGKDVDLDNAEQQENQEEKLNTYSGVESLEKQEKQEQKGLKRRQMSNIYEIENSQLETEPYNKVTENNQNTPNIDEVNQLLEKSKSHIQIEDQNENKSINEVKNIQSYNNNQANNLQKTQHNDETARNENTQPPKQLIQQNQPHQNKVNELPQKPIDQTVENTDLNKQQSKQQATLLPQNSSAAIPEARVQKQQSQQICGIKSQFQLTSMLENAIG